VLAAPIAPGTGSESTLGTTCLDGQRLQPRVSY
jgi:hypothetical protein